MNHFCTACGQKLDGSNRFCTSCGAPVAATPAPPPPLELPSPASEAVEAASPVAVPPRRAPRALRIILIVVAALLAVLGALVAVSLFRSDGTPGASSGSGAGSAWTLKIGEGQSLYAIVAPAKSTLNLKAVVLACEVTDAGNVLNLQLYPSGDGPLLPNGAQRSQLTDEPRMQLEVDDTKLTANIYFAGDFAVIADQVEGGRPTITASIGNALERGSELTLRFSLLRAPSASNPFDAYAVVDLKSTEGTKSIAAVRRRCGQ